ncbi:MAG TPA: hypothetical protein VLH35_02750 [Candidatus Acidoferrales bacterium]|nr:hypothetical protein [Candidatus Acidoferrales bacterium]
MVTRFLRNRIRGWFPQEPLIRSQAPATPIKPINAWINSLNAVSSLIIAIGALCAFAVLHPSWIKNYVLLIAIIAGLAYLVAHRRPRARRIIKNMLVPVMIFTLCFTAVEVFMFWNAGYPATFSPSEPNVTLSMQGLLNASVVDIVKGIEESATFNLLKFEHGNDIMFESMILTPAGNGNKGGYISVDFNSKKSEQYIHFYSGNGHQYSLQVSPDERQIIHYTSIQEIEHSLRQIDSLGLSWFYNQAIKIAENRTANVPTVDSLTVNLVFQDTSTGYEGLIVQIIGYHQTTDTNWENVLISAFQPDGELIYMTKPRQG